ncbi:hypothetical protein BU23DRAFT_558114 [Bimuria novae-zelandiae CBS 107.79]|uniref:Extracellular membrane protein CFEM domain-containing protein n=1 Tax=Bimuria novae-zelandiae CBS 107.79 TaxID=1447943 RepID=A0A6A5UY73_9PLEO|nr:hypothetical protein BU23DRAFT_558114 [Bimuria novae-zelandiae CBS 107.79]
MHFQKLALVFALSAIGLAQDVDQDDVPQQCQSVCSSIVSLTRNCDNSTNDDAAETQCICNGNNASSLVPLCAAYIAQNGGDRESDVYDIVRSCSFSSTSYDSSAAATALSSAVSGASSLISSGSTPATASASQTSSGAVAPTASSSSPSASDASATDASSSADFSGASPVPTFAAAAVLGALGLALML